MGRWNAKVDLADGESVRAQAPIWVTQGGRNVRVSTAMNPRKVARTP
ncbi:hypothetical protein SUDANB58_04527 [Streptomyces sp. enrichment culture]